jgi:hypothetical protein
MVVSGKVLDLLGFDLFSGCKKKKSVHLKNMRIASHSI